MSLQHLRSTTALVVTVAAVLLTGTAEARITRLEVSSVEPVFGGRSFEPVGPYKRVRGRAFGEVDPNAPANAIIQDIQLAPRNARGMVEYATEIDILRPADLGRGNGVLFFNILNRGNKGGLAAFNADVPPNLTEINSVADPGDGFMLKEGYTLVWFGWQADVLPGNNRMTMSAPVARNADGSPITGLVRAELTTLTPTKTLNLSSGWFTTLTHASYPTASPDNRKPFEDGFLPTLTVRAKEQEPRVTIPNADWAFGSCPEGGEPTTDDTRICYSAGFEPGKLYELIYRAKDPLVLGLGYAVTRDLAAFLKNEERDTAGTANPVFRPGAKAIVMGTSQSGRMIRSFLHLGFNEDEGGRLVFEGAYPHIGGGLIPLNVRFAQPGRAWGHQIDHLYPAYDFPFSYAAQTDPISGRTQGILDRCSATHSCPKIFHVATALEVWEGRQSLGLTDPLGRLDVPDPATVRTFILASTQHVPANLPLPTAEPFGHCQQQANPNPQVWTMRALLTALTAWVKDDKDPPASVVPRIVDGTLVAPDQVRFPPIPANAYGNVRRPAVRFLSVHNPLHPADYGPEYNPADMSGVITQEPPGIGTASYGILVPQVDEDGNDVGGLRSAHLQVPIGTYTGWNLGRAGRFENGFCSLQGSFIPFARTKLERLDSGDRRLSLEERYLTKEAYVEAMRGATSRLVSDRLLLPEDAKRLLQQAEGEGIRLAP
ncbi:alpha/beta hydrolase domain-containing protein [Microvirga massiliensis]|uniref:alpha/beta hydrolase domain-containing protein n=1 Tax=Microvirga massiliensis TaxID=1033741 RepID=UPI00062B91F6|nr:alpha/beta hydrolase domain-containing protein [Microvirga massiliensis]